MLSTCTPSSCILFCRVVATLLIWLMEFTTWLTSLAPLWALSRVRPDCSDAWPALRATSSTVEFISVMALAVDSTRARCVSAPRDTCSICAESSSEAAATRPEMFEA